MGQLSWSVSSRLGAASPCDRNCNSLGIYEGRLPSGSVDTSYWRCRNCRREAHMMSHKNWGHPNQGSSKYFMVISCIHTTTRGEHTSSWIIVPYRCNFTNGDNTTPWMSSFYITFCRQRKYILPVRVCSVSTAVTSGNKTILMHECGYEIHFSISVWVGIIRNIVMGLLLVRLTAEQYCEFLETTAGAAWRYASTCEAKFVVSLWWNSYPLWGICLAMVECNLLRKVD